MSMEAVLGIMVTVVGVVALALMVVLTIQIYKGNARPEDRH